MPKGKVVGYPVGTRHTQYQQHSRRVWVAWIAHRLLISTILFVTAALMLALGAWIQSIEPVFPQQEIRCPYGSAEDDCVPAYDGNGVWHLNQRPDTN